VRSFASQPGLGQGPNGYGADANENQDLEAERARLREFAEYWNLDEALVSWLSTRPVEVQLAVMEKFKPENTGSTMPGR